LPTLLVNADGYAVGAADCRSFGAPLERRSFGAADRSAFHAEAHRRSYHEPYWHADVHTDIADSADDLPHHRSYYCRAHSADRSAVHQTANDG
jgi:hypothetical protein